MSVEELEVFVAELHAERYPSGCGPCPGHHCEPCLTRLGQPMHTCRSFRRGARAGNYLGTVEIVCTDCTYRSNS